MIVRLHQYHYYMSEYTDLKNQFDEDLNYRVKVEIEAWKARDPIEKLTSDLGLTQHEVKVLKESIDIEVKQAFDFAEKSPFPEEHEAYTGEYAAQ